jgi:hypothetical protein
LLAAIALVVTVLWGLAWYFSPHIYASSVVTAATTGDLGTLIKRIDAERIRSSGGDDLSDAAMAFVKPEAGKATIAAIRAAVDHAVSVMGPSNDPLLAERLANLMTGKGFFTNAALGLIPKELLARRSSQMSGGYGDTHDLYYERVNFRETGEEMALMFERRGTLTWRLVGVKTNGGSVLLPLFAR